MITHTLVGPLLQLFFTDHLIAQRRLSLQTVASYRDTFRLLLQFVHRDTGIEPAALEIPELDAEIILRFLDALEKDRGNTVVSRNLRLTAIRSFYRMVALRDPADLWPSPEPCDFRPQELRSVAWKGSKGPLDPSLAQNRAASEGLVSRVGTIRRSNGIPEHSRRAADTIRYPFVVAESGRAGIFALHHS